MNYALKNVQLRLGLSGRGGGDALIPGPVDEKRDRAFSAPCTNAVAPTTSPLPPVPRAQAGTRRSGAPGSAGGVRPTPSQARGGRWRRSSHGLYVPGVRSTPDWSSSASSRPPWCCPGRRAHRVGGAGGGWVAAGSTASTGGTNPTAGRPGHLLCRHPQPGRVRRAPGTASARTACGARRPSDVRRPWRSLCFLMRYARNLREAVELRRHGGVLRPRVAGGGPRLLPRAPRLDGDPAGARRSLADENSWSRWETWMRLVWQVGAGFPRPLCNRPVFDLRAPRGDA